MIQVVIQTHNCKTCIEPDVRYLGSLTNDNRKGIYSSSSSSSLRLKILSKRNAPVIAEPTLIKISLGISFALKKSNSFFKPPRAVLDACKGPPELDMTRPANIPHKNLYGYNRRAARHFFVEGGPHFRLICEMAGRNPDYVQGKVRKVLLRKNGWNVDVPITSHYRQGPNRKRGRPRKKYRKTFTGTNGVGPKLYVI